MSQHRGCPPPGTPAELQKVLDFVTEKEKKLYFYGFKFHTT